MKIKDCRKREKVNFSKLEFGDIFMVGEDGCVFMKIRRLTDDNCIYVDAICLEDGGWMIREVVTQDMLCTPLDCTLVIEG